MSAVEFEDVSLSVGGVDLFRNLSCQVPTQGCTLLVGPTGSGKTSFFRLIKGLIPFLQTHPMSGTIKLFGETKTEENFLAQNIEVGMLFQDTELQFIGSSVGHELAFGLEILGLPPTQIRQRLHFFLGKYPFLQDLWNRQPHTLSGGELVITELCATLITEPKLILLDEPLAFLDPAGKSTVVNLLQEIGKSWTTIIATHDFLPFLSLAETVIALDPEKHGVAFQGSVREFLSVVSQFSWVNVPAKVLTLLPTLLEGRG